MQVNNQQIVAGLVAGLVAPPVVQKVSIRTIIERQQNNNDIKNYNWNDEEITQLNEHKTQRGRIIESNGFFIVAIMYHPVVGGFLLRDYRPDIHDYTQIFESYQIWLNIDIGIFGNPDEMRFTDNMLADKYIEDLVKKFGQNEPKKKFVRGLIENIPKSFIEFLEYAYSTDLWTIDEHLREDYVRQQLDKMDGIPYFLIGKQSQDGVTLYRNIAPRWFFMTETERIEELTRYERNQQLAIISAIVVEKQWQDELRRQEDARQEAARQEAARQEAARQEAERATIATVIVINDEHRKEEVRRRAEEEVRRRAEEEARRRAEAERSTVASLVIITEDRRKEEARRLAEEAEARRLAEEVEVRRLAEEAEARRLAEEEAHRLAERERAAIASVVVITEAQRRQEAEQRRQEEEQRRQEEERRRQEAEQRRQEAEQRRQEAERQRLLEEEQRRRKEAEKKILSIVLASITKPNITSKLFEGFIVLFMDPTKVDNERLNNVIARIKKILKNQYYYKLLYKYYDYLKGGNQDLDTYFKFIDLKNNYNYESGEIIKKIVKLGNVTESIYTKQILNQQNSHTNEYNSLIDALEQPNLSQYNNTALNIFYQFDAVYKGTHSNIIKYLNYTLTFLTNFKNMQNMTIQPAIFNQLNGRCDIIIQVIKDIINIKNRQFQRYQFFINGQPNKKDIDKFGQERDKNNIEERVNGRLVTKENKQSYKKLIHEELKRLQINNGRDGYTSLPDDNIRDSIKNFVNPPNPLNIVNFVFASPEMEYYQYYWVIWLNKYIMYEFGQLSQTIDGIYARNPVITQFNNNIKVVNIENGVEGDTINQRDLDPLNNLINVQQPPNIKAMQYKDTLENILDKLKLNSVTLIREIKDTRFIGDINTINDLTANVKDNFLEYLKNPNAHTEVYKNIVSDVNIKYKSNILYFDDVINMKTAYDNLYITSDEHKEILRIENVRDKNKLNNQEIITNYIYDKYVKGQDPTSDQDITQYIFLLLLLDVRQILWRDYKFKIAYDGLRDKINKLYRGLKLNEFVINANDNQINIDGKKPLIVKDNSDIFSLTSFADETLYADETVDNYNGLQSPEQIKAAIASRVGNINNRPRTAAVMGPGVGVRRNNRQIVNRNPNAAIQVAQNQGARNQVAQNPAVIPVQNPVGRNLGVPNAVQNQAVIPVQNQGARNPVAPNQGVIPVQNQGVIPVQNAAAIPVQNPGVNVARNAARNQARVVRR